MYRSRKSKLVLKVRPTEVTAIVLYDRALSRHSYLLKRSCAYLAPFSKY